MKRKRAKIAQLAEEVGLVTYEKDKLVKYLGHAISKRLRTRGQNFLYQSAAFSIPNFPRACALTIFPVTFLTENSAKLLTWRLESMAEVASVMGCLMSQACQSSSGCTRGE